MKPKNLDPVRAKNISNGVDEYIAKAPKEVQWKLNELRKVIKAAAPSAEERMSYGMPGYYYKGQVVYFGIWKEHIGLYALPINIEEHKDELKGYVTSKGTIQLPLSQKLPVALINKFESFSLKNLFSSFAYKEANSCKR